MKTVLLQLERLGRHYNNSVRNYDHVSLLDLSHTLRVWTELKVPLRELAPKFATTLAFKTAIPAKKVMRAVRNNQFIFAYMPGGVTTYASNGQMVFVPHPRESKASFSQSVSVMLKEDGFMVLKNFCFVGALLEQSLKEALKAEDQTRCNYENWLSAEAVRVRYPAEKDVLKTAIISREMIMKRVANTLDGSHPSAGGGGDDGENNFDAAINYLLQYQMGGLPLPYFILLKIAQDILSITPKLLGVESKQSAM